MLRRYVCAVFLAGVSLAGRTIPADEGEAQTQNEPLKHEVTVVASRTQIAAHGSTVRVVSRDEIEKMPARSVPELLRALPGLDVRRRGIEGVQADIGIRGADYNGTLIMVDGEPVNDPQTNHHSADLDLPLDAIDRIEVLYGSSSALYGSGAVGGVVNIITRSPDRDGAARAIEIGYAHGSDSLDSGSLSLTSSFGPSLSGTLRAARSESTGFRDDTEFDMDLLHASVRYLSKAGPISASAGYGERDFGAYAFYGTRYPNQKETTRVRTARVWGELTAGEWAVMPSASLRLHHDDFILDRARPDFYENIHDTTSLSFRLAARRPVWGGSAAFGCEAGSDSIRSTNLGDHDRGHQALFFEYARPLRPSGTAPGGIRFGIRADAHEGESTHPSPYASATYAPTQGVNTRASISTAFRMPTFTELYYSDPQNRGNPDLAPERAVNGEIGVKLTKGMATLDAVYFARQGQDLIDYVRSSPDEPYQALNIREATFQGMEAVFTLQGSDEKGTGLTEVSLSMSRLFADLAMISEEAGGATEGKYVLDPIDAQYGLTVQSRLLDRARLWTRLSHFTRSSRDQSVWLLDARVTVDIGGSQLYLEGNNLGDARYQEVIGTPLPGRTFVMGLRSSFSL